MSWWKGINKSADEIDRDVRRRNASAPARRPVIRDEVDAQDESIAQAVSMGRTLVRGLREAARMVREDREQGRK